MNALSQNDCKSHELRLKTGVTDHVFVDENATFYFGSLEFGFNLFGLTCIPGFFIELEATYGRAKYPKVYINSETFEEEDLIRNEIAGYLGVGKKWWAGRNGIHLTGKVGYDLMQETGKHGNITEEFKDQSGVNFKLGLAYNLLVTRAFQLSIGAECKVGQVDGYELRWNPIGFTFMF
jgi:hypothetical protein